MGIVVENPGMLTTVQDIGRSGWQRFGVPVAGAMDGRALRLANLLVGNDENQSALEVTITGPTLRFSTSNYFAITGADFLPKLNGRPIPSYSAILAREGDVLSLSGAQGGCRGYVAFAGGLDVPEVMGSRSTYMKGSFGGFEGRKLRPGDKIPFTAPHTALTNVSKRTLEPERYSDREICLRVVRGPQDFAFTEKGYETFLGTPYAVTDECDRMGVRLEGEGIEHVKDGNMISDGIALGSVQVPSNGKPIIMLADRQTTGGYTKIATVVSVDIPLIAQSRPGTVVHFREVDMAAAQELYNDERSLLESYRRRFEERVSSNGPVQYYSISVDGKHYYVEVEEIEDFQEAII